MPCSIFVYVDMHTGINHRSARPVWYRLEPSDMSNLRLRPPPDHLPRILA